MIRVSYAWFLLNCAANFTLSVPLFIPGKKGLKFEAEFASLYIMYSDRVSSPIDDTHYLCLIVMQILHFLLLHKYILNNEVMKFKSGSSSHFALFRFVWLSYNDVSIEADIFAEHEQDMKMIYGADYNMSLVSYVNDLL